MNTDNKTRTTTEQRPKSRNKNTGLSGGVVSLCKSCSAVPGVSGGAELGALDGWLADVCFVLPTCLWELRCDEMEW